MLFVIEIGEFTAVVDESSLTKKKLFLLDLLIVMNAILYFAH